MDAGRLMLLLGAVPFTVANGTKEGSGVSTKEKQARSRILTNPSLWNDRGYWGDFWVHRCVP